MMADPRAHKALERIESRRIKARVPKQALARAAGISGRAYRYLETGERNPLPETVVRLRLAIRRLEADRDQSLADRMIVCVFKGHFLVLAAGLQLDGFSLLQVDPRDRSDERFGDANRLRAMAAYMTITGLNLEAIKLAAVVGVTKQAMSKWLGKVEDMRDDPEVDALLDRVAEALGTETGW